MEILGSLIIAILQSILFYGKEIGISMVIFTLIGTGIIWYILNKKDKIVNKKSMILMIPIILLSITYLVFANRTFYVANIIVIFMLIIIMFIIATMKKNYFREYIYDSLSLIKITISEITTAKNLTNRTIKNSIKTNSKIYSNNIKKVATSLFIVFVVVGIVIMLLASADSIFASIFSDLSNFFKNISVKSIGSLILRVIIFIIVYLIALSLILVIQKKRNSIKELKSINNDKFTIKVLLVVLNVVYLVFCFIQIKSLFAQINLAGTFNYAQYARSGFFQLMIVSFINFKLILISNKDNEKRETFIKILNLFLVVFTIIIVASSMYRMYMYETEYGYTYLRIFVYIILATELIIFLPTTIYIFKSKFDLLKWVGIIGLCVYVGINYTNLESIIINRNISNTKVDIDYEYIGDIATSDSYNLLEELLNEDASKVNAIGKYEIAKILIKITDNSQEMYWQEFNISKHRIKDNSLLNTIDIETLEEEAFKLEQSIKKSKESSSSIYLYDEMINKKEGYRVYQVDKASGDALWRIDKTTNGGTDYLTINTIEVKTASTIEFFKDGIGFLTIPDSVQCGEADLYITTDSGKNFTKIEFPDGEFTLSNPEGKAWADCYDYFYLPTLESDGTLTVLVSGGYEGGYNSGLTRAKYISSDSGKTWEFVSEIFK